MNRVLPSPPPPPPPPPRSWQQKDPLETESQPQKKHKMNEEEQINPFLEPYSDEENDTAPPREPILTTFDTDEEDYCGTYNEELWEKYTEQVERSEGFDITDFPGRCFMTTVFPMPNYLKCPANYDELKDFVVKALKEYNKTNGTSYEVDQLLKVNGGGCRYFIYYISFSVNNGKHRYFQAKVVDGMEDGLEFPLTRPRPDQNLNVDAVVA